MKHAISITMGRDTLMWLKGQAAARTGGNVSELINRIVDEARAAGGMSAPSRTVVGTIDLPDDDSLAEADAYVKSLFERSLARPMLVRERPPKRPGRRG